MGERNVRFIVTEINKLLKTDYNMISFDSLSKNNLLQICADCLSKLDALPKVDVEKNTEESLTRILEAFSNMKVPLPDNISINEFTDGIIQAKRSILHPVLVWVLSNQNDVKKRAYFARYLKKVPVPMELSSDPEIQQLLTQYDARIQEFKNINLEKTKFQKMGNATLELRKEIDRITNDMIKVNDQIEKQKPKVDNIPNKESLIVSIKSFRSEVLQEKTLEKQMEEQKRSIQELQKGIKKAEETLEKQRALRLGSGDILTKLRDEVHTLRVLVKEHLPHELMMLRKQAELMAKIVADPPPSQIEIEELQGMVDGVASDLQKLMEINLITNDPRDDKLAQFRQHVTVIANNKQMAADRLLELKEEASIMKRKVEEKECVLQKAIGGKMPQGEELKRYVSKLRARSIIYKERRSQLQEMQAELGVLNRTLDILKNEHFQLAEALESKDLTSNPQQKDVKNIPDNKQDLIVSCKELAKKVNNQKADTAMSRQELQNLKTNLEDLSKKHERAKEIYESSVSNFAAEIKKLENEVKQMEEQIAIEEERWKQITKDIENKEDIMQRLNDDHAYGDERKTQKEILEEKIAEQKNVKKQLADELEKIMSEKEEREQQVIMWYSTLELLKCKKQWNQMQ